MKIIYGNTDGVYFSQWRFDELTQLASEIAEIIEVDNWYIHYDTNRDFHMLEFDFDNRHYVIEYYKVFTIYFDNHSTYGDEFFPKKNFGRSDLQLINLFKSGRYKEWNDV